MQQGQPDGGPAATRPGWVRDPAEPLRSVLGRARTPIRVRSPSPGRSTPDDRDLLAARAQAEVTRGVGADEMMGASVATTSLPSGKRPTSASLNNAMPNGIPMI